MIKRRFLRRRMGLVACLSACIALACALMPSSEALAADPTPTPVPGGDAGYGGVQGPWLDIHQIFWFTEDNTYDRGDEYSEKGETYVPEITPKLEYGEERMEGCYYYPGGPEADAINGLWNMTSCRLGLLVSAVTWIGVGIALMAFAWGGVMWVVDADADKSRMAGLRNVITGPLIGLLIMFLAFPIARFLYTIIRYNFERYIDVNVW